MTSADDPWCKSMALDWAKYRDYNVCRVNWASLSFVEYFSEALTGNIQQVARYAIKFMDRILHEGYQLKDVVCVGHSFGGHICGFIGEHYKGEIPLIVGLDIAGIGFTIPFVMPRSFRLDETDAKFVMAVHSCNFGLGPNLQVGHQDFYINSGLCVLQKGCVAGGYVDAVYDQLLGCGHYRAVQIFHDSLNPVNNKCIAKKCFGVIGYALDHCLNVVDRLGFDSKR